VPFFCHNNGINLFAKLFLSDGVKAPTRRGGPAVARLFLLKILHIHVAIRSHFVVVALMVPSLALAKRIAPAKVEPVVHQGVRYIAPNDDGRRAYIEAWNIRTNKKLWDLTIFTNRIDPTLEEDVQWVFIKALNIRNGTLIVTSERDKIYRVDLKTKTVTESEPLGPRA
jgi:hypothetical protein